MSSVPPLIVTVFVITGLRLAVELFVSRPIVIPVVSSVPVSNLKSAVFVELRG